MKGDIPRYNKAEADFCGFPDVMTAAGFLNERHDFLYVYVVRSEGDRRGWDVVCRMDGTYTDETDAVMAATGIRQWLLSLRDGPKKDLWWWHGAPWLKVKK